VLDGNVARVLARLGAIHGDLREPQRWQELQKKADRLLEPNPPGDWNQAMMELGATLCTPKSPQCLLCPVAQFLRRRRLGSRRILARKKKEARHGGSHSGRCGIRGLEKGRTLLFPPPKNNKEKASADHVPTLVSRMWHFPTLSVTGEPAAKLIAYLHNSFQVFRDRKWQLVPAGKVRHAVTYRAITLLPFLIIVEKTPSRPGARQVPLGDISSLPVSNLTRKSPAPLWQWRFSFRPSTESYPFAPPRFRWGPAVATIKLRHGRLPSQLRVTPRCPPSASSAPRFHCSCSLRRPRSSAPGSSTSSPA